MVFYLESHVVLVDFFFIVLVFFIVIIVVIVVIFVGFLIVIFIFVGFVLVGFVTILVVAVVVLALLILQVVLVVVGFVLVVAFAILVAYPGKVDQHVVDARRGRRIAVDRIDAAVEQFAGQLILLFLDELMEHAAHIILLRREVVFHAERHIVDHKPYLSVALGIGIQFGEHIGVGFVLELHHLARPSARLLVVAVGGGLVVLGVDGWFRHGLVVHLGDLVGFRLLAFEEIE